MACAKLITTIDTFMTSIDTQSTIDKCKLSEYLLNFEEKKMILKR